MANENKVTYNQNDKRHGIGGTKDTDIEDLDTNQYDVYTSDKNLADAQSKYPNIDWFACFTIKDKSGGQVGTIAQGYTIKFDKPEPGKNFYYYYNNTANQLTFSDAGTKGNKQRVKVTLNIGDPPIGSG